MLSCPHTLDCDASEHDADRVVWHYCVMVPHAQSGAGEQSSCATVVVVCMCVEQWSWSAHVSMNRDGNVEYVSTTHMSCMLYGGVLYCVG